MSNRGDKGAKSAFTLKKYSKLQANSLEIYIFQKVFKKILFQPRKTVLCFLKNIFEPVDKALKLSYKHSEN